MTPAANVLVISRDPMLLQTRKLILGTYFEVKAAGRIVEAEAMMGKQVFDLIVLCYSLSDDECRRIANMVRLQNPRPKILVLSGSETSSRNSVADQQLPTKEGSYALLKKSAEMLAFELKIHGRIAHA